MGRKLINIINKKFNNLTAIEFVETKNRNSYWRFLCDCGVYKIINASKVRVGDIKSCGCKSKEHENLSGQSFNYLTFIKYIGQGKQRESLWLCRCKCGTEKQFISGNVKNGHTKSCGCLLSSLGKESSAYTGYKDISGTYWNQIKEGAKVRNIEFNISIEEIWKLFIKQNKKCALSGLKIKLESSYKEKKINKDSHTASLDRIDSSKGYITGNIQWVHKDINLMKLDHTQEEFINLCKLVSNQNPSY